MSNSSEKRPNDSYQKAEDLRKAKQYAEAEALFAELWQSGHRLSGWRYAFCLRKQGKLDEALDVGYDIIEQQPDDTYAKSELVWAIYSARIRPAEERNDLPELLSAANEALRLGANDMALRLIVFAVAGIAKGMGKWDIVANWCDRLDYTQLNAEAEQYEDQQKMSDRERWFYARVKAASELKQWEEARTLGLIAKETFPRKKDFARWAAKAHAEQAHLQEAIAELQELLKRGRPEWYLYYDLASVQMKAGDTKATLRNMCEAALASGEDKGKVGLFLAMSRLYLLQNEPVTAAYSVILTRKVREREGWGISNEIQQLEAEVKQALADANLEWPIAPDEPFKIQRMLQETWRKGIETDVAFMSGTIQRLHPDKDFGFIRPDDGGENVFFKRRDVPSSLLREGQHVAFVREESYDAKKQKDSFRAVKIRQA